MVNSKNVWLSWLVKIAYGGAWSLLFLWSPNHGSVAKCAISWIFFYWCMIVMIGEYITPLWSISPMNHDNAFIICNNQRKRIIENYDLFTPLFILLLNTVAYSSIYHYLKAVIIWDRSSPLHHFHIVFSQTHLYEVSASQEEIQDLHGWDCVFLLTHYHTFIMSSIIRSHGPTICKIGIMCIRITLNIKICNYWIHTIYYTFDNYWLSTLPLHVCTIKILYFISIIISGYWSGWYNYFVPFVFKMFLLQLFVIDDNFFMIIN